MHIVLFDIDGTLINSDGAGRRALSRAFERAHAWEDALGGITLHGNTDPAIVESVYLNRRQSPPTSSETARFFGLYLQELPRSLKESRSFRVLPGVGRLLARLSAREDTVIGLATGNIERGARLKLRHGRLDRRFAFGGFGSDARDRADIVRAAIGRATAYLPEGTEAVIWLVGDMPSDIKAGKAAGVRAIAVATGGASEETLREAQPDVILPDLSDCDAFLSLLGSAPAGREPAKGPEGSSRRAP